MKDVLFRGRTVFGRWVYGYYAMLDDGREPHIKRHYILTGRTEYSDKYGYEDIDKWEIEPETLGMCTGLRDMTGRQIFEGDILRGEGRCDDATGVLEYGVWNCGCCYSVYGFALSGTKLDFSEPERYLKVIGNICDNPELAMHNRGGDE